SPFPVIRFGDRERALLYPLTLLLGNPLSQLIQVRPPLKKLFQLRLLLRLLRQQLLQPDGIAARLIHRSLRLTERSLGLLDPAVDRLEVLLILVAHTQLLPGRRRFTGCSGLRPF